MTDRNRLKLSQAGASPLAAADAEKESILVTYAGETRVLLASVGKKATIEAVR